MSRGRLLIMGGIALALLALMAWQSIRLSRIEGCIAQGKAWNGPVSRCDAPNPGVIMERELKRT